MNLKSSTPRWRIAFEVGSTVAMVALGAVMVWQGLARSPGVPGAGRAASRMTIPAEPIPIGDSALRGSVTAPVALIEYSDFQCPFCARFAREVEPVLRRDYVNEGRLVLVYKHFPLSSHQFAPDAARASWCAGRQGRFWDMHDRLFSLDGAVTEMTTKTLGVELGLDAVAFENCRVSAEAEQMVNADRAEGERLGVSATPLFLVGRVEAGSHVRVLEIISGAQAVDVFQAAIDRAF